MRVLRHYGGTGLIFPPDGQRSIGNGRPCACGKGGEPVVVPARPLLLDNQRHLAKLMEPAEPCGSACMVMEQLVPGLERYGPGRVARSGPHLCWEERRDHLHSDVGRVLPRRVRSLIARCDS